jgi:DNA-binding transcriptional regulator GbsR (MarR family)
MQKKKDAKVPPELGELTTQIGTFIQYWGFKKIHGEIWTHIFLAQNPIDATTLVKRLHVSKALVSLALKDLLEYNVIKIVGQGSRRKILFQSNPNMSEVICSVLRMRERKMLSRIMSSHKCFQKMSVEDKTNLDIDSDKMVELGRMIEDAECVLDSLISCDLEVKVDKKCYE